MTAPRRAWITAIRPVSVIGAAALASVALSVAPWQVVVRAPQDGASSSAPHLVPLRSAALHCPGPETEGLAGVPAVAGGVMLRFLQARVRRFKRPELAVETWGVRAQAVSFTHLTPPTSALVAISGGAVYSKKKKKKHHRKHRNSE